MPIITFQAKSQGVPGTLVVENQVRSFKVIMDEPPELGGTDTGVNPVEALLAALGSCQAIVAAAFARAHGIDLQEYRVEVDGDLDPDGFLKGTPGVRNGFQEIRLRTHIKSNSPAEKVEEFYRFIQTRCPVGDTLENGTPLKLVGLEIESAEAVPA